MQKPKADKPTLQQKLEKRKFKTPSAFVQYKFSQRRTAMRTKREMKDKGFVLPEQLGSDGSK